jgi:hypothetical protein
LIDVFVQEARQTGATWSEIAPNLVNSGDQEPEPSSGSRPLIPPPQHGRTIRSSSSHDGKYRPLWEHLRGLERPEITLSFNDVERILGFPLPPSSRAHQPHWYGYKGSAVARAIIDAGWKARNVDLVTQTVTFTRNSGRR